MLALVLAAPTGCSPPGSSPTGTVTLPLRTTVGGSAYRLRSGSFAIAQVGGAILANILTETDVNIAVERRVLAPGNYTMTLAAGWRLEKQTLNGFQTVTAQLSSPNPVTFTIVDGQTTPVNYAFLTDGVVVALGETAVDVTIGVTETNAVPVVRQLAAGFGFTCALIAGGNVRCWGDGGIGVLGYGNTSNIGDNETPASAGNVNVGGAVVEIAAGLQHVCARLASGGMRCWGHASLGKLGYGNVNNIGDNETPASAGDVNVGAPVLQITAGGDHTCAQLGTGAVRCWGSAMFGQLGYGNTTVIGDNEFPSFVGDVNLGSDSRNVFQVAAGSGHTCTLHSNGTTSISGAVRCWGGGSLGQLGYGNVNNIGDNETPIAGGAGIVLPGTVVAQIATGGSHTCALLTDGSVRCWGQGAAGRLGYGNINNIGDNELPSTAGAVNVGGTVVQITAGMEHTCALLSSGGVRCWGEGASGRLGYGNTNDIGDNETPASAGDVAVGGPVLQIVAGATHTCAILTTGAVRCWGEGFFGQLGYGNTNNIGDNEVPASAGDVTVVVGSGSTTFPLTVTVVGNGFVDGSPGGIFECGPSAGICNADYASGLVVTLTANPIGAATFVGWGGSCSGTAPTATVTMSQARTCTATFTSGGGTAPTFAAAGAGVEGLASLVVPYPAGLQANDLLVLQVGSRTANTTPATPPAGFSHLDPAEAASVNARQRLYFKVATGAEAGTLTVNLDNAASLPPEHVAAGRLYAFRGVRPAPFTEAPTFMTSSDGTLDGPTITTTGAGRLAVAFTSLDNNQPMAPFVGETGGDWTEPLQEFPSALGMNFAIQLQIAPLPAAATLSGGVANFGGLSDASICRAFALIGN